MKLKNSLKRKLKTFSILLISFFCIFSSASSLFAQSGAGFFDPYNYDLRNARGMSPETDDRDLPRTYDLTTPQQKPNLVNPKSVPRAVDVPATSFGGGANPLANPTALMNQLQQNSASGRSRRILVNPLTGEVDPQALATNQAEERERKLRREKARLEYKEAGPYQEDSARRFEIIFFLTLPPAVAVAAIAASGVKLPNGARFFRTTYGLIGTLAAASGLAFWNAKNDQKNWEEFQQKKKEGKAVPEFDHNF